VGDSEDSVINTARPKLRPEWEEEFAAIDQRSASSYSEMETMVAKLDKAVNRLREPGAPTSMMPASDTLVTHIETAKQVVMTPPEGITTKDEVS
jgi:hypothetical protein